MRRLVASSPVAALSVVADHLEKHPRSSTRAAEGTEVIQTGGERVARRRRVEVGDPAGFIPAMPQNDAGLVIEPPVWLPIAP